MSNLISANSYCKSVFDGTHDTPKPVTTGKLLITSKHITGRTLNTSTAYLISDDDFRSIQKRSQVSQWDILFSMIGSVGEIYLEKSDNISYVIKNIGVFSCRDENQSKWLFYYLQSPSAKSHINRYLSGAVQKFLPLGALREFPVIPFDDKKVDLIKVLDVIDAKIELNNRINAQLEAMAKTLYDYWFVQFDFPDAHGKPYKTSGGKMVWNDELKREIPEGWSSILIESLLFKEPSIKKIPSSEILESGFIPVIDQSSDFIAGFTNDKTTAIETKLPRIIFGDHTRIIKLINFSFARGADGTQILLSNSERMPQHLFYQTLLKIDLSNYGYARHFKFLKGTRIVLPNTEIAQKYEGIIKSYYSMIKANIFQNQTLAELRDWLLPMLMNGQVTVK